VRKIKYVGMSMCSVKQYVTGSCYGRKKYGFNKLLFLKTLLRYEVVAPVTSFEY
jgi:hypothetical protein